jgi:hypothetical protein
MKTTGSRAWATVHNHPFAHGRRCMMVFDRRRSGIVEGGRLKQ